MCGRQTRRALCLRCRVAFMGLTVIDGDGQADDQAGSDTVVAVGYPPSLREVVNGDD